MRRTHLVTALVLFVVLATVAPAGATTPSRAAPPTRAQILEWCAKDNGNCFFVPDGKPVPLYGERVMLTGRTSNCTSSAYQVQMTDETTDTTTDNVGGEVSVSTNLFNLFDVSLKANYSHTWQKSRKVSIARTITLRVNEIAWFERAAPLLKVTGKYVYRRAEPMNDGEHFFFADNIAVTGPDPSKPGDGDVIAQARKMTAQEMNQCVNR
jgi:hypothetical protein